MQILGVVLMIGSLIGTVWWFWNNALVERDGAKSMDDLTAEAREDMLAMEEYDPNECDA